MFVGSARGGPAAATFYSLMATCKKYEINPYEYLVDVLTRLPECETDEDYEKLVPGKWTTKRIGH
ncbi:MAG: transposase domain-containing protein [Gammaproteobacteria bacterium]|nr:transposase domain-containing protein [Gammaproteobacteria bacterium]MDH5731601.1 transposase domain-containing protein [Gammaproteobacteria bacterium]